MARSASQRLALWERHRDDVEDALLKGVPIVSYSLDGQTTTKEATSTWLATVDQIIADLRKQASGGLGSTRNLVRFTND